MLISLMNKGIVSKKSLLLENYTKADLCENDVMIILMIMHLSENSSIFITPNILAEKMNLSVKEIDKAISKMADKNYIKFISKKIDFTPLFARLIGIVEEEFLIKEHESSISLINSKLNDKLSEEQVNEMLLMINGTITKQQLLKVINQNDFDTYIELTKLIEREINYSKPKIVTRFNWLEN